MVNVQIARRGIRDRDVLDAMRQVPREAFVRPGYEEFAYEDGPLPIGEGQTISQPYIVALMIEAAELKRRDRVLEVGAGSGYAAAVMSRIAERVYAIERVVVEQVVYEQRDIDFAPLGAETTRQQTLLGLREHIVGIVGSSSGVRIGLPVSQQPKRSRFCQQRSC